eukprot:s4418_g9.t1
MFKPQSPPQVKREFQFLGPSRGLCTLIASPQGVRTEEAVERTCSLRLRNGSTRLRPPTLRQVALISLRLRQALAIVSLGMSMSRLE